jgi:TM2 domain-containing membrane protein YozV
MNKKNNNGNQIFAIFSSLLSLFIPGLGQLISLSIKKGLLLIGSFASIIGLFIWRINLIAPYDHGFINKLIKTFHRKPTFTIIIFVFLIGLWILNIIDAYKTAKNKKAKNNIIFVLILILFFTLGWQISQINLYNRNTLLL